MEKFTTKGLVVLPPQASYLNLTAPHREQFIASLGLLPQVFESNYGIKLFYFNTNVIFGLPMPESMEPIFCLCRGDVDYLNGVVKSDNFFELVCDTKGQFIEDEYESQREKIQKTYPFNRGITLKQRMKVIETRERELARLIAQKFSLVITFENNDNPYYGLKTKKLDGRILLEIELPSMTAKGYFSGETSNIVSLMNRDWAYKKVYQWEAASL